MSAAELVRRLSVYHGETISGGTDPEVDHAAADDLLIDFAEGHRGPDVPEGAIRAAFEAIEAIEKWYA